jgi:nucleotide-binding universal stress UspA family protein
MRVLVATDLSPAADVALAAGAAEAASRADVLGFVNALPMPEYAAVFSAHEAAFAKRRAELKARTTAAIRERVRHAGLGDAEVFVDEGRAAATILRRAETWRADLIVVGSHGHAGLSRVLGGTTAKVVHHAHCPVLVARNTSARGWVLAATDLSDPSLPAIQVAAAQARRRGARLKVVKVVGFSDMEFAYLLELASPAMSKELPALAPMREALRAAVAKLGIDAKSELVDAPAAAGIVREAETLEAELVVIGTHGPNGLARLGLGSVADKVVRAAPCSVLVVRQHVAVRSATG